MTIYPLAKQNKKQKKKSSNLSTKLNKSIKKEINNQIARNIDNKQRVTSYTASIFYSNTTTGANSAATIINAMARGTSEGQRIGDDIKVKYLNVKGRFYIPQGTTATEALNVRVIILNYKKYPAYSPTSYNDLFRSGTTSVPAQNNDLDMFLPINKQFWNVYLDKRFKVGQSSVVTGDPQNANNDFKLSQNFNFNLTKSLKRIKFGDDDLPSNRSLYMLVLPSRVGGQTGSSASDSTLRMTYVVNLIYENT